MDKGQCLRLCFEMEGWRFTFTVSVLQRFTCASFAVICSTVNRALKSRF
jgi:hypothetical protein